MKIHVYHPVKPWQYQLDLDRHLLRLEAWPEVWQAYLVNWNKDEDGYYLPLERTAQAFINDIVPEEFWEWVPD